MRVSTIFSARNITLFVFILVVLLLGTMFNVHVGHESFQEGGPKVDSYMKETAAATTAAATTRAATTAAATTRAATTRAAKKGKK